MGTIDFAQPDPNRLLCVFRPDRVIDPDFSPTGSQPVGTKRQTGSASKVSNDEISQPSHVESNEEKVQLKQELLRRGRWSLKLCLMKQDKFWSGSCLGSSWKEELELGTAEQPCARGGEMECRSGKCTGPIRAKTLDC